MAYITIPQLSTGTALNGLEQFEAVQAANSVKLTGNQIKTFTNTAPSLLVTDSVVNDVSVAATLTHETSGVPVLGIGVGLNFSTELNANGNFVGSKINSEAEVVSIGSETVGLSFQTSSAGAAPTEKLYIAGDGATTVTPDSGVTNNFLVNATGVSNAVIWPLTINHATAGNVASTGIGTGIMFQCNLNGAGSASGVGVAQINAVGTDLSAPTTSKFDFVFKLMRDNQTTEVARITSDKKLGVGTNNPAASLEVSLDDANGSSSVTVGRFTHTTSSTPSLGIGTAVELATETLDGTKVGAAMFTTAVGLTVGVENFTLSLATMTSGVTAERFRVGDMNYSPRPLGVGVAANSSAWLHIGAGTTANASAKLTAGTLLTTPLAGSIEYDGYAACFTPISTERGLLPAMQYFQLGSDLALNGAITTAQSFFGKAVGVSASTRYGYELNATITATNATSKVLQYGLGGTAVLYAHDYEVISDFAAAATTVAAASMMQNRITSGFSSLVTVTAAGVAGAFNVRIRGSFDILSGGAGTVDFQFGLTVAGTSVSCLGGSNVSVWPINTVSAITNNTQIGNWS